jgi:transposase-like protein
MSDARSVPFFCPYCGEEDLRPNEASHGAWECHACARVFTVKFNGLLRRGSDPVSARSELASPAVVNEERLR